MDSDDALSDDEPSQPSNFSIFTSKSLKEAVRVSLLPRGAVPLRSTSTHLR
jgi:hypothetical protein